MSSYPYDKAWRDSHFSVRKGVFRAHTDGELDGIPTYEQALQYPPLDYNFDCWVDAISAVKGTVNYSSAFPQWMLVDRVVLQCANADLKHLRHAWSTAANNYYEVVDLGAAASAVKTLFYEPYKFWMRPTERWCAYHFGAANDAWTFRTYGWWFNDRGS